MKQKIFMFAMCMTLCVCLMGCQTTGLLTEGTEVSEAGTEVLTDETAETEDSDAAAQTIYVDIAGAVNQPGVYPLPQGARVFQLVEAAGGFSADADTSQLNQAAVLNDGDKIMIYTVEETKTLAAASGSDSTTEETLDSGLININTADENTLETLPGIGETKAAAIVAYRSEHGNFSSVDEIVNVSGIGDSTFAQIKALICVS